MLKHLNYLTSVLTVLVSLSAQVGLAAILNGTINNAPALQQIKLYSLTGGIPNLLDSAKTVGTGAISFSFQAKKGWPRGIYQIEVPGKKGLNLILGNEPNVSVNWDANHPEQAKFSNSPENVAYQAYWAGKSDLRNKMKSIETRMQTFMQSPEANTESGQKVAQAAQRTYDSLLNLENNLYKEVAAKNPKLYIGKVAELLYTAPNAGKADYFTKAQLNDPELTRGDMLVQKLHQYLQKFMGQNVEGYRQEILAITALGGKPDNTNPLVGKELILAALADIFRNSGVTMDNGSDASNYIIRQMVTEFPNGTLTRQYKATLSPEVGDFAPDITLENPDGKRMSLHSLKGQVVLLDFWASWCRPCRMENPNVVKAYNAYKDKGFNIFSVSLDQNKEAWQAAITKDGLVWPNHVSDLKGWSSSAAALYKVGSIPAAFLVNQQGIIVARSLRGEALENKLKELLEKK